MISFLKGKFIGIVLGKAIVDVNGVGYGVWLTEKLLSRLKIGSQLEIYVYTHVRQDQLDLFGFLQTKELELFQLLLQVSGVGPKSALVIVGKGVEMVQEAIIAADVSFFTTIPRIGKKNAQKIIIELKSKLGSLTELELQEIGGDTKEIIEALQTMGFSVKEALASVRNLPENITKLEDKVRYALKMNNK